MSQFPTSAPSTGMQPHRGTLILVLGILGIVLTCVILGIIAWVMGNGDLKAMDAGQMDPSGRSLTNVGRILGIVSVCITVLGLIAWVVLMVLGVSLAAAGAAGSP